MDSPLRELLSRKGRAVVSVTPDTPVIEAVQVMNDRKIGAVLVVTADGPVGIFSERDVLRRILADGRDPRHTRVAEVMTADLITVPGTTTVHEAMAVMTEKRCRHLPIVEGTRVLGLVSIGDLTQWVTRHQRHEIESLVNYVTGRYPA